MAGASKSKQETTQAERTPKEQRIIQDRATLRDEQRQKQEDEIGHVTHLGLGDKKIASPRFVDLKLFQHIKIPGIDKLLS